MCVCVSVYLCVSLCVRSITLIYVNLKYTATITKSQIYMNKKFLPVL